MRMPVPKYFMIRSILESRLERNYAVGDRIPTEAELGEEFEVSRITIQQAMALLQRDGLVKRERGRGTFYTGPNRLRHDVKPSQLLETLIRSEPSGFARLISTGIVAASPRIAERLNLKPGASVVSIDRVGFINKEPILFIRAYLPSAIGKRLLEDEAQLTRFTLGELVEKVCGIRVGSVVQTIAATLADPSFAKHLGVEVGAPVLEGERTYKDQCDQPILFSDAFYRADRHRFVVNLNVPPVKSAIKRGDAIKKKRREDA